jgi:hypothetical protein
MPKEQSPGKATTRRYSPKEKAAGVKVSAHSRTAGMAMGDKHIDAAHARWRAVNAPLLVALVRAGGVFHKGKLLERRTDGQEA